MKLEKKNISNSLNKSYLTQNQFIDEINLFKENYAILFNSIKQNDSEETLKDYLNDFLKNTYYKGKFVTKENINNIDILLVCAGYVKTNISLNALTANGKPQNKMDIGQNNGMMPEILANKILKAISRNKKELTVGGKEVLGVYIKRFFPNLFCKK